MCEEARRNHVDAEEGKVVCVLEFDFGALGVNSLGVRVRRCCQLPPRVAWGTPVASGVPDFILVAFPLYDSVAP